MAAADQAAWITNLKRQTRASYWLIAVHLVVGIVGLNRATLSVQASRVRGNSMLTIIYPGDVLFTIRTPIEQIHAGEIIRFRQGDLHVVHRVVAVQQDTAGRVFLTQGDNNITGDAPVPAQAYEGKVILILPGSTRVRVYLGMGAEPGSWRASRVMIGCCLSQP